MHLLYLIFFFIFSAITYGDDLEKYRPIREQCQRAPSNSECLQLKSKFLEIIKKCIKIQSQEHALVCQQVKLKLCAVFPNYCVQTTTKRRTSPRTKKITTLLTTTTTTRSVSKLTTVPTLSNAEFVKVPVNPEDLRTRGEYCIRHGKEKKCQELLNNLKSTYSSCNKKKPEAAPTKPEELDCHSFQSHLCKAFPKFPPCLKKTAN